MNPSLSHRVLLVALLLAAGVVTVRGEFRDDFDRPIRQDETGQRDWNVLAGDGTITVDFAAADGIATLSVDATTDRRGIWWAVIKRDVSRHIKVAGLAGPSTELRVEARIRTSHAPRRINLSFNTQRTTDYHANLMEFDIAEPNVWQTISFTTENFETRADDRVYVQLAMMDWGLSRYHVDIEYLQVSVVDPKTAGPDLGVSIPYHPSLTHPARFLQAVVAAENATVDQREPDANLADWAAVEPKEPRHILTVNGTQMVILRWELAAFAGRKMVGSGLLELKTYAVERPADRRKDFGLVRVVEILGGDPRWDERTVTYESLLHGIARDDVINPQPIIDTELNDTRGGSSFITIPRPVLQRLLDGKSKGIAVIALGSINASFLARTDRGHGPLLRFNVEP